MTLGGPRGCAGGEDTSHGAGGRKEERGVLGQLRSGSESLSPAEAGGWERVWGAVVQPGRSAKHRKGGRSLELFPTPGTIYLVFSSGLPPFLYWARLGFFAERICFASSLDVK